MKGNWPENVFDRVGTQISAYISRRVEHEIAPLQKTVADRRHPWSFIVMGVVLFSGLAVYFLSKTSQFLMGLSGIVGLIGIFFTGRIYVGKAKHLKIARLALSDYLNRDVLGIHIFDPRAFRSDILDLYQSAGFFGEYETVESLKAFAPQAEIDVDAIFNKGHFMHTHLTRTEVRTVTDSHGRTRQDRRIINVFQGVLLSLPFEDVAGPNRLVLSTGRIRKPRGPFMRRKFDKALKLDEISPASPRFKKLFTVKCDDETAGHGVLDPDRVMRFLNLHDDLAKQFDRQRVALSFMMTQGRLWAAIETGALRPIKGFSHDISKLTDHLSQIAQEMSVPQIVAIHLDIPYDRQFLWEKEV